MSEIKRLIKESRDWLNAFDVMLNGEDSQIVELLQKLQAAEEERVTDFESKLRVVIKECCALEEELQAERENVALLKEAVEEELRAAEEKIEKLERRHKENINYIGELESRLNDIQGEY